MWDEPLPISSDEVVRQCLLKLGLAEPWVAMPADDIAGELRHLAAALINPGCDTEMVRRLSIVRAASEHGAFRRCRRVHRRAIAADLATLREVMCDRMGASQWGPRRLREAIVAVVAEIELALAISR